MLDPATIEILTMLVKYGSPLSTIIAVAWALLERSRSMAIEKIHRTERDQFQAKIEALARESIRGMEISNSNASIVTSLLGIQPRRGGRGGG